MSAAASALRAPVNELYDRSVVIDGLNENDMGHIPIFCGGIIPKEDYQALYDIGVKGVFGPGTTLQTIIDFIHELPAKE